MRGDHDRRYSRVSSVSFINYLKGVTMSDLFAGLAVIAFWIACFGLWAYGVAICWAAHELFWAVVCFAFAPAGVIVGAYNLIF